MGWYRRSPFSLNTFRNVFMCSNKHLVRNPLTTSPDSGKSSHLSVHCQTGFSGSSLFSTRFVQKPPKCALFSGGRRYYCVNRHQVPDLKPKGSNPRTSRKTLLAYLAALLGSGSGIFIYYRNLETIPYTNRTHFMCFPVDLDKKIGEGLLKEFKWIFLKGKILGDTDPQTLRVKLVAQNMFEAFKNDLNNNKVFLNDQFKIQVKRTHGLNRDTRNSEHLDLEVFVIDEPTVANVFCFPGGKIVVFTALLQHFETDAEIATFLGHAMGHFVARHMVELYTKDIWKFALKKILYPFVMRDFVDNIIILKPRPYTVYSTEMEMEAEYIGKMLMASAGYDPDAMLSTYEKLGKITGHSTVHSCNKLVKVPSLAQRSCD